MFYRNYYWIKFFMGKRPILQRQKGFHLRNQGFSNLGRRIAAVDATNSNRNWSNRSCFQKAPPHKIKITLKPF